MKLADALIAWNPASDQVRVDALALNWRVRWDEGFLMSTGGCCAEVRSLSPDEARARVLSEFVGLVVRDRVDIAAAHREFLKIEEYRDAIPEDLLP